MAATAASTETIEVLDPATGEPVGTIPASGPEEADAAVRGARQAAHAWARTAPGDRAACLKAGARALRERLDEVAELQTREGGKPIGDSRGGVEAGIGAIEQYAELGPLHRGQRLQGGWEAVDEMVREPRGVVALLTPWNDPVAIACQGIAAALAAGNAVVFKPSEKTPLSGELVATVLQAELPEDVLTLLHGDGRAGAALVAHPQVDAIVHTGSVATGRTIAQAAAGTPKHLVLELGGKDPLIVDRGVDPRWAAQQAALGAFANAGQICTAVERIYVHRDVADAFTTALVEEAERFEIGPLIDAAQRDTVDRHVCQAVAAGARLETGGAIPDRPGFFYPPTVLTHVPDDTPLMREETFGPVAPVRVVDTFEEALGLANRTDYGLAATVLTDDDEHARIAARELVAGTVKINAVFGGAPGGAAQPRKASGHGFGYGPELLDELTVTKVVHRSHAVRAQR